jgi:hypothetical protein
MDLTVIEQQLVEARDALMEFWTQGEGAACFIALPVADSALADYRACDEIAARRHDPESWQRIEVLAGEVMRLRAPLDGTR